MSAPNKVYLQLFDQGDGEELDATLDEVTWCQDKINDNDVEYVLSSKVAADLAQLRDENIELRRNYDRDAGLGGEQFKNLSHIAQLRLELEAEKNRSVPYAVLVNENELLLTENTEIRKTLKKIMKLAESDYNAAEIETIVNDIFVRYPEEKK